MHAHNFKDLTGQVFGRLTVLFLAGRKGSQALWRCLCECSTEITIKGQKLRNGHARSCGCLRRETTQQRMTTHGHSPAKRSSRTYKAWANAKSRCFTSHHPQWKNYGGRGISMCARWKNSFENFLADMGACPPKLELERMDNNAGYFPGNCKWATESEQCYNQRRNTRKITIGDVTLSWPDWAKRRGMAAGTLYHRLDHGWPVELAIFTPVLHH